MIYSLGGVAGMFIGIFLVPVYTRVFSPNEYGVIDLIATLTALLNLFLILGLDSAVGRYYVDVEENRDRKRTASTAFFYLAVCSAIAISFLVYLSEEISALLFGDSAYSIFLVVALAAIPFTVLFTSFQNLLRFSFRPFAFAATSIGCMLLQASLIIYFVVFLRLGISGIYMATLATFVIFSGIGFWLTRSSYSLTFSYARLKELLHFGVPLVPLSLAHYIMTYSDRYFLRYFSGLDDVGLYGVGYRLASVLGLLVLGFQKAWGPFVYSIYKDKDAKRIFSKTYDYVSIATCLAILGLSIFAKEILLILTTPDYIEAYKVIPFIATSIAAYTFGGYFSFGIGIAKKNIHRAWSGFMAALVNLGLNYLLIPPLGMIGAAIATIISFLLMGVVLMRISQRYYRVEYKFMENLGMYFITALMIFIAYNFIPSGLTFESIGLKLSLLVGFSVVPFLLKLVGANEIRYIAKILARPRGRLTR